MGLTDKEMRVLQELAQNLLDKSVYDALMGVYIKGGTITKNEYKLLKKIANAND